MLPRFLSSRATSIPLMFGIEMSRTTRSGLSASTPSSAACPSDTMPTISNDPCNNFVTALNTGVRSSASRTRLPVIGAHLGAACRVTCRLQYPYFSVQMEFHHQAALDSCDWLLVEITVRRENLRL